MEELNDKEPENLVPVEYIDLIKALNIAVAQCTMYSKEHPLYLQALESAYQILIRLFEGRQEIIFGIIEDKLLVEDSPMDEKDPIVARFFQNFKKLKIDSLAFLDKMEIEELRIFIGVLSMRGADIEKKGGPEKLLNPKKTPHIKIQKFHYERLSQGQIVVSAAEGERVVKLAEEGASSFQATSSAPRLRKESFYRIMMRYLKGEIEDLSSEVDEVGLIQELERNPRRTAIMLLEVGRELNNMQLVIERLGNWLLDLARRKGGSLKRDLSEMMSSFGKKIQEELLQQGEGSETIEASEALGSMVSQYVDKIKIQQIMTKFDTLKKKTPEAVEKIVSKLAETKEERDRLLPEISDYLKSKGMSDKEFEEIVERLKHMSLKDGTVEIPASELKRLYELERIAKEQVVKNMIAKEKVSFSDSLSASAPTEKASSIEESGSLVPELEKVTIQPGEVIIREEELAKMRETSEKAEEILEKRVRSVSQHIIEQNKELAQEVERSSKLMREISSGIIVVDKEEKVILINRAAEELLGIPKEKLIGYNILEQLKDEHLLALARRKSDALGDIVEISSPNSNTKNVIKASTAIVEDEDGRTIGMLFVLTDVAKHRELENIKQGFLSRVSHHLYDPIVGIQDSLLLLLTKTAGELNEEQKRLLDMAKRNVEQLRHSISELLTVSDIQEGRLRLNLSKFDIVSLAESCGEGFRKWEEEKSVQLQVDLPKSLLMVEADKEKIELVLNNLIANSFKATSKGGKIFLRVTPYVEEANKAAEFAQVSVEDTGRGIPDMEIEKVFEKFSEVGAPEEKLSGLGLGLSLAKEIINLHNGKIWVESKWAKGGKFSFTVPLAKG